MLLHFVGFFSLITKFQSHFSISLMYQTPPHFRTAASTASPAYNALYSHPSASPPCLLHTHTFLPGQFLPSFKSQINFFLSTQYSMTDYSPGNSTSVLHSYFTLYLYLVNYLSYASISCQIVNSNKGSAVCLIMCLSLLRIL